MEGIRFYLEYENRTEKDKGTRSEPGNHKGTVIGVMVDLSRIDGDDIVYDAVCAVSDIPNGHVCSGSVSRGYLNHQAKWVSEALARKIHPNLFIYLDYNPEE